MYLLLKMLKMKQQGNNKKRGRIEKASDNYAVYLVYRTHQYVLRHRYTNVCRKHPNEVDINPPMIG